MLKCSPLTVIEPSLHRKEQYCYELCPPSLSPSVYIISSSNISKFAMRIDYILIGYDVTGYIPSASSCHFVKCKWVDYLELNE